MTHPLMHKPAALSRPLSPAAVEAVADITRPLKLGDMFERVVAERIQQAIDTATKPHLDAWRAVGLEIGKAFDADSGDAEADALNNVLNTARTFVPDLPEDDENWAR